MGTLEAYLDRLPEAGVGLSPALDTEVHRSELNGSLPPCLAHQGRQGSQPVKNTPSQGDPRTFKD